MLGAAVCEWTSLFGFAFVTPPRVNSTRWSKPCQRSARPPTGRVWGRAKASSACSPADRPAPHNDYLPQPHPFGCHEARRAAAAAAASTAKGEVGGAQPAKPASTDGCLRLASSNSEGAGAEREGFEPSVGF